MSRRKPVEPLTQEERDFAQERHGLIYWFLNLNHLSEDNWYDIIALGYLKAVKQWFRKPEIQRWSFKTIARIKMHDAYARQCEYLNRKMRSGFELVSLDAVTEDYKESFESIVADVRLENLQKTVISKIMSENVVSALSLTQQCVLSLRMQGYSHPEIGRILGTGKHCLSNVREQVKKIIAKNSQIGGHSHDVSF